MRYMEEIREGRGRKILEGPITRFDMWEEGKGYKGRSSRKI
jgi:hypothetical protein